MSSEVPFSHDGQDWTVSFWPPPDPPAGKPHGAEGFCLADGHVVMVSADGKRWGLPGGRPEPGETLEETFRREVDEEACATVLTCRLLGFNRGTCLRGPEQGLVIVRSVWLAEVRVDEWAPRFEIPYRRLVPAAEAFALMEMPDGLRPYYRRVFTAAGL